MDCKLNKVEKKVVDPTAAQLAVPKKDLLLYFLDIVFTVNGARYMVDGIPIAN